MSKQNQLGGIDDFKEFKSDSSKQNQLGGSDALGKSLPISYCMHFWTQVRHEKQHHETEYSPTSTCFS